MLEIIENKNLYDKLMFSLSAIDSKFKIKSYRRTGAQINAIQYECLYCHGYVTRPLNKEERKELKDEGKLKSLYRNLS